MRTIMRKNVPNESNTDAERLGSSLRDARRQRKLTQQTLADHARVARRTITNAECSGSVGVKEFCRMANALGYELVLRPVGSAALEDLPDVFTDG